MKEKEITIQDIIAKRKEHSRKVDTKLIMKAYNLADGKHKNQCRKSGEPYIIHPMNVAYILADIGLDDETICAALLHDTVEDTDVTDEDLRREFGEDVANMVAGVTKLNKLQFTSIEEQQVEDYRKMFLAMGKDIRVILIKLADRLHNMRTLKYLSRERQIANAKETQELYAPLANRLGVYNLKWELEDLSFKYLNPEDYKEIVDGLNKKRDERLKFINKIIADIQLELKRRKIDAEVTGRAKHLYSIYRKMKRDNKTLDQIYDLFALRILVKNVKDCYAALGVVHEMYNPMPGRFKDYISVPKPNMYQSIHTTLLGEKGTPFEVQIRTYEMHRVAEFGIAAHWAYKEASYSKKGKQNVKVSTEQDKLSWLRETLEWQKELRDPDEFLKTLKTELFEDEVYVFTPKGKIEVLPRDATPIDFAYAIHEEIGHHMCGCKINSKMMPIVTKLKNGDIVEILTNDSQKGPSRDWLKFIKTTKAKSKIQGWYKREQRDENIEKGKDLVEKEIKRIGMSYEEIFKYVNAALERYKFKNVDDMYATVGFGAISAGKVIARMLQEYRKEHKEENLEEKIEELAKSKRRIKKTASNGVIVKGIDNCLVKLSKCCNPVPGDEIIGYITKGRGVSIHRKDCTNIDDLVNEESRIIDVAWADESSDSYQVDIEIYANDRSGLLADIIRVIGNTQSKLIAVNSRANKDKTAITEITIEVENKDELKKVMNSLQKVDNVYEVKRRK